MATLGRRPGAAPLTSADIPDNSITSAKIVAGAVGATDLADNFDDKIQTNIALLAFKTAVNGSLAKYNLQDQIVDEYVNATGIDDGPSTNHALASGAYKGGISTTPTVSGGTLTSDDLYSVRSITSNTDFITDTALTVDYLIVGGGGAGGMGNGGGGGGGAGGYISATSQSLAAGTFAVVVGTGGTGIASNIDGAGGHGTDSSFNSQIGGGGAGGPAQDTAGVAGNTANGGSGSGNSGGPGTGAGGAAGTQGTASAGGSGTDNNGGGGGGAGGAGGNAVGTSAPGNGGVGLPNDIVVDGTNVYYAGGGGGSTETTASGSTGGNGGGGNGGIQPSSTNATDGADGKGGGGGGGEIFTGGNGSGDGGNGIVIIRYLTSTTAIANMTLQSTDTEAEAQPTKADMVILIEDAGTGVGTVNTHIKGHISRDSGTTFTEGELVDEGDWGDGKRILAFHDLDISGQPSDQTMCYKITTHSASAVYDTKIHATSLGWR